MVLRRVMGLVDNGRYFAQCASKRCKFRVWLVAAAATGPEKQQQDQYRASNGVAPQLTGESLDEEEEIWEHRWSRRHRKGRPQSERRPNVTTYDTSMPRLYVQRSATGEFI